MIITAAGLGGIGGKRWRSPRCEKPMTRYEAANGPMLDEPACGRPAGHPGPCRSAPAWARVLGPRRDPGPCACGCGELTAGWGPCKAGHHMRVREAA